MAIVSLTASVVTAALCSRPAPLGSRCTTSHGRSSMLTSLRVANPPSPKFRVIPEMSSGLGNQLFKIAAAIVVAAQTNKVVTLCKQGGYNVHITDKQAYLKTIFRSFEMVDDMPACSTSTYSCFKVGGPFVEWGPEQLASTENVIMEGYFQYFPAIAGHEKEIITVLNRDLLTRAAQSTVGLHIRRGDYIN